MDYKNNVSTGNSGQIVRTNTSNNNINKDNRNVGNRKGNKDTNDKNINENNREANAGNSQDVNIVDGANAGKN